MPPWCGSSHFLHSSRPIFLYLNTTKIRWAEDKTLFWAEDKKKYAGYMINGIDEAQDQWFIYIYTKKDGIPVDVAAAEKIFS